MNRIDSESTLSWYDTNAKNYASNIEPYISIALADTFVKLLGEGKNILDAGSAAGRDTNYFLHKGLKVTGVELSKELNKIAKEKYPEIDFVNTDFRKLPFEKNSFDGVWAHASLVHMQKVKDVKTSLKEFKRVLKTDGILYIYVKTGEKKTDIVSDKLSGHKRFFRYYSKKQIEGLIEEQNFKIISSEFDKDIAGRADVKWIAVFARKQLTD
jgi:ubiquinone/menaquinone biosynthesis C-methylase UbiE